MTRTPKTIQVDLPSGARVRVKQLTAGDMSALRDLVSRIAKSPDTFTTVDYAHLLDRQVVEVSDVGPYDALPNDASARRPWPWRCTDVNAVAVSPDDWLEGDVGALAAAVYCARWGSETFKFRHMCPGCRTRLIVGVDVMARLGCARKYTPEFLEAYKNRRNVEIRFDASYVEEDGNEVKLTWRPVLGASGTRAQERFIQADDGRDLLIRAVAYKLVEFEGEKDRNAIVRVLRDLDERDVLTISDVFADHEGGVENVVEVDCDECGQRSEAILPFEQLLVQDVVAPRRSQRGRRRRRS